MDELPGKVALVTGSAGGIGLGIARACAGAGMKVVLSDIDEAALEQAAAELEETGADVMAVPLDVTDRDGWARAARDVPAAMGPVQLLVNNAGVSTNGMLFEEIGPELWDRVVSINLTSVYNGVHYFLEGMLAAGGGHIVSTSSMGGLAGFPGLSPYSATKFAVVGLSESLRAELAGQLRSVAGNDSFDFIQAQRGMFSLLGVSSAVVDRLRYKLATHIALVRRERGGSIEIRFSDEDELTRIVDVLLGDSA